MYAMRERYREAMNEMPDGMSAVSGLAIEFGLMQNENVGCLVQKLVEFEDNDRPSIGLLAHPHRLQAYETNSAYTEDQGRVS